MTFSDAKTKFDSDFKNKTTLNRSLVPVDGKFIENVSIRSKDGSPNEEYYKWQFIFSIITAGLFPRDYIGAEVYFPKGNKNSAPLKIDAVIFESAEWLNEYRNYRQNKDQDALNYLRKAANCVVEFKKADKRIEQVFSSQIKAAIKEPDALFVLGVYYDSGRLYLFKRLNGKISRYDNSKNYDYSQRILEQYQLEVTDPYYLMPDLSRVQRFMQSDIEQHISAFRVEDLDVVYTINDENVKGSLNQILRCMDSVSLYDETGYLILIQLLAMKIFDEKQSESYGSKLRFYVGPDEICHDDLGREQVQQFMQRLQNLYQEAQLYYKTILNENKIDWKNLRHVRLATAVISQFQKYSLIRSKKSDLYQLVFYNFATEFKKDKNAQFLTPLPIIDFMVQVVNPRRSETVCDPCCGIGDFLSVSYINSGSKLDDKNLYGFDNDYNMCLLAQLNMLLNGDGNAVIRFAPDKGSINQKLAVDGTMKTLRPTFHKSGNWDEWPDSTQLMKYDVILTNPPFGKGRSLDLSKAIDREMAEYYELHDSYVKENPKAGFDLGVVFLENAVRSIKPMGRFAIVLSNSIASNNTWKFARKWLLKQIRIVALFDLPPNVFAETGVNTTIVVGYKPLSGRLNQLQKNDYSIFTRDIELVGYTKKTVNRNVVFDKNYRLNEKTFETETDESGESLIDEEFTAAVKDFREWCLFQEEELKKLFLE
jgi:type I restriction enzyme M protein